MEYLLTDTVRGKLVMAPDATSNARDSDRVPLTVPLTLLLDPEGQRVRQPAHMLDMSDRGLRLKTSARLAPGQIVDVIPRQGIQFAERSRVVWVTEAGSEQGFEVGLEFLNPQLVTPLRTTATPAEKPLTRDNARRQPADDVRQSVGDDRGPMAKP